METYKAQVQDKLDQMNQRLLRLEGSETNLSDEKEKLLARINALNEQVRKLNCLHSLAVLFEKSGASIEEILRRSVELILPAMRYPEAYCVRIVIDDQEYKTSNFAETDCHRIEDIRASAETVGIIEVFCLREMLPEEDLPFTQNEESLIQEIAQSLGQIIDFKHGEAIQLYLYHNHLRTEEALRESEAKYSTVVEKAGDGIAIIQDGTYQFANKAMEVISGYHADEIVGMPFEELFLPEQRTLVRQQYEIYHLDHEMPHIHEYLVHRKDGTSRHVEISFGRIRYHQRPASMGFFRDITERKKAEETIRRLAYHDALTGLPNRVLFNEMFARAKAHAGRNMRRLAVMLLDLDRFKEVNDTLGHTVGDQLLKAVALRLTGLLRTEDMVARMGGDEFMIFLNNIQENNDAEKIARKVVDSFGSPFIFDGRTLRVTTSLGVALYPDDGNDIDTLMKNADIAMYRAKQQGRNSYCLFNSL